MSNVVIGIYNFFHRNKIAFFAFTLLLISLIIFTASKIRFEEDISGIVSKPGEKDKSSGILQHFRFSEKLIVLLSPADTTLPADPSGLILVADSFNAKLIHKFDSGYIRSISGNVPDTLMTWYMDFFYRTLPLYLDPQDYSRIDSMISPESVKKNIRTNFQTLSSPAGFVVKKSLLRDPLGLTYLALNKLWLSQNNDKYDLVDGYVMTHDKKNLLLFITPANPPNETLKNTELLNGIDKLLSEISQTSGGKIKGEYFGAIAMSCGNANRIKKDILLTVSVAIFLILLLLGFYFKSIKIPILSFLPAIFGGGLALAVIYLVKTHISAIALGIGSVILGLIVDYALYIINHFRKKRDILAVLKELSLTIFLCAITTIGAFLCMIFLQSSVLHDLGLFAALSVAGAAIFALIFLPHFLSAKNLPLDVKQTISLIEKIAAYPFEKNFWLIGMILLFGIASIFTISRVDFETDMMAVNFYPGNLKNAEKHIDKVTGGSLKNMYLVSTGKNLDEALENNEKMQGQINILRKNKAIIKLSGIGFLLPSSSLQEERLRKWNDFWTQEKITTLENSIRKEGKLLTFRENAFDSFFDLLHKEFLPLQKEEITKIRKDFLSDWINENENGVMVSSVLGVVNGSETQIYQSFNNTKNSFVFDRQLLAARFVDSVRHDFELLVKFSMIFVTLLLLFSLGRIELAIIAAMPMYFSWLLTLGFLGITGIRFNIFNIIVSSFIFGLGVDYSILMLRGLLQEAKYGTRDLNSYKISIILSSATTLFGVGALFFAKHPALHSIALVSMIGIILVVMISFTLQPLLANECFILRLKRKKYPVTARIFIKTFITWGNIVLVAIILTFSGIILRYLIPISKKKKEHIFHKLFQILSRTYIQVTFPPKSRKLFNAPHETFEKPAVIISNHQSLIETPAFLRLHSKIIILTTTWVYKSVVFGSVARLASFFNADLGIDSILGDLEAKVAEGYSILVFPEAHRSQDGTIQRFHKGAFYLAEKLQIDILPIVVFGTGDFLGKGVFWGRPNAIFMKILDRVGTDDMQFGQTYRERTKNFRKFYVDEYKKIKTEEGTGDYYRRKITLNYIYKGPILEWYFRVKMKLAGNYQKFNTLIPREGKILDLGCGYGFISTMLFLTGTNRIITGIDYDQEKIAVAQNCYLTNTNLKFVCSDITTYEFDRHDAFLISDVLHYLKEEEQELLLERCIENLNPGGVIVIREADRENIKNHKFTKTTELFSTKIFGFNKTSNDSRILHFTSMSKIKSIASANGLSSEIVEIVPNTSNVLLVLRK
jgi:uncharacterized protein